MDEDMVEKKQRRATAMKLGTNQANKQAEWGRRNEIIKEKKGRKEESKVGKKVTNKVWKMEITTEVKGKKYGGEI